MPRCSCSARALEIFIKDFAGLNIRRAAARTPTRTPACRTFSTRPSRRQHVETRGGEDDFVPFEFEKIKRSGAETGDGNVGEEKRALGVEGDEEWHAEIEIAGSWPKRTRNSETKHAGTDEGRHGSGVLKETEGTRGSGGGEHAGGDVVGRDGQPPSASHESVIAATAASSISATGSIPDGRRAVGGRSRAENRLARKQRRMLAGNFAPAKAERAQNAAEKQEVQEEEEDGVASALEKIEGMAGPPVPQRRGKDAEAQPPTKWALKKARLREKKGKEEPSAKTKSTTKAVTSELKKAKKEQPVAKSKAKSTEPKPEQELWQSQKAALQSKFGAKGWDPNKKVSPDTMAGIRALHHSNKAQYNTATLSKHFEMSPEAIRRILRSKWTPTEEEAEDRRQRWEKRGVRKWDDMAKKGIRPPKKWREAGVGWERKSRSSTKRSEGLRNGRRVGRVSERKGELEEGVGMLSGIDEEERIL